MKTKNLSYDITTTSAKKAMVFFFIKLAIAFATWYFISGTFLKPARVIDKPLTNSITISVVECINLFSPSSAPVSFAESRKRPGNNLIQNNKAVLGIYDSCNSTDLIFTYLIVILLLPYPLQRKVVFSLAGIVVITGVNIIRIVALYYINQYQKEAFVFSHEYLFTILMDILIFCGWLLFIQKKATA